VEKEGVVVEIVEPVEVIVVVVVMIVRVVVIGEFDFEVEKVVVLMELVVYLLVWLPVMVFLLCLLLILSLLLLQEYSHEMIKSCLFHVLFLLHETLFLLIFQEFSLELLLHSHLLHLHHDCPNFLMTKMNLLLLLLRPIPV
jgi:hypothetical protein